MNTAIYSPSGASAGIGFAVPVDTVNRIVPELIAHGKVVRPVLGVVPVDGQVNAYVTHRLGVEGALLARVSRGTGAAAGGPAGDGRDRAGRIVPGDVIQEIDGKPVKSRERPPRPPRQLQAGRHRHAPALARRQDAQRRASGWPRPRRNNACVRFSIRTRPGVREQDTAGPILRQGPCIWCCRTWNAGCSLPRP